MMKIIKQQVLFFWLIISMEFGVKNLTYRKRFQYKNIIYYT